MNEEIARIRETLEDSDFLKRSFPVLFHPGVKDEDVPGQSHQIISDYC